MERPAFAAADLRPIIRETRGPVTRAGSAGDEVPVEAPLVNDGTRVLRTPVDALHAAILNSAGEFALTRASATSGQTELPMRRTIAVFVAAAERS